VCVCVCRELVRVKLADDSDLEQVRLKCSLLRTPICEHTSH
jgi:hypothetical protein